MSDDAINPAELTVGELFGFLDDNDAAGVTLVASANADTTPTHAALFLRHRDMGEIVQGIVEILEDEYGIILGVRETVETEVP